MKHSQLFQLGRKTDWNFKKISELPFYFSGKSGVSVQCCMAHQRLGSISHLCPLAAKARGYQDKPGVWEGEQQHLHQHAVARRKEWAFNCLTVGHEIWRQKLAWREEWSKRFQGIHRQRHTYVSLGIKTKPVLYVEKDTQAHTSSAVQRQKW